MFKAKEIVEPSGKGRTAGWGKITGTVTKVLEKSVIVQWQNCAVEDEMKPDELISTGKFAAALPHVCRELRKNDDGLAVGELLTINDEKK